MKFVIVETHCGPVKGLMKSTILGRDFKSFTNIPYMKGPIGKLKFRDPEEPEKWTEALDATRKPENYSWIDVTGSGVVGRDDASFINIYVPVNSTSKALPVMVHVMSSGQELQGPDYLLQKDVIVVTFNHRIGVFGYLSLSNPSLEIPGNAGLKDQVAALKWVQKNIGNFGGDSNNITLFGCSHGSYSINYLMISDQAKGLFHRAIMMAGTVFNRFAITTPCNWNERFAKTIGYEGEMSEENLLEFFENCDAKKLGQSMMAIANPEEKYGNFVWNSFAPVIEPYITEKTFIPEGPALMVRNAWASNIDIIVGANSSEGLLSNLMGTNEAIEYLHQNESCFAPLQDLQLKPTDERAKQFGKRIKEVYYGKMEVTKTNLEPYFTFMNDGIFWHGIQRMILARLTYNTGKNFMFYFDAVTEKNYFKHTLTKTSDYLGACHGDEMSHILKADEEIMKDVKHSAIESDGFKVTKNLISLWTNFAANGNPNSHELSDITWEPLKSKQLPLSCLNITEKGLEQISLPISDRLAVWNSVYEDAGVPLC